MIAAYIRVSTRGQDAATQRHAIELAAKARKDKIVRWYEEKASASTLRRAELTRLRNDAHAGKIQKLYVFAIDRLSRSGIRDTFHVVQALHEAGSELVSVTEPFAALSGPVGEIFVACMAWSAKQESAKIGNRISAARARKEAKGEAWGRPRRVGVQMLVKLRRLRAEGRTIREIAVALKVPKSTVEREIQRTSIEQSSKIQAARMTRRR